MSVSLRGPAPSCPECGHVSLTLAPLPTTGEMVCLSCFRSITGHTPLPSDIVGLEGYFDLIKGGHVNTVAGPIDVCVTPSARGANPVPIPYPNQSSSTAGTKPAVVTKLAGAAVAMKGAVYKSSTGDEPGTKGTGTVSSSFKGPVTFTVGTTRVTVNRAYAVGMLDPTFHNRRP